MINKENQTKRNVGRTKLKTTHFLVGDFSCVEMLKKMKKKAVRFCLRVSHSVISKENGLELSFYKFIEHIVC